MEHPTDRARTRLAAAKGRERGQSLLEYQLLIILVAIAAFAAFTFFGRAVEDHYYSFLAAGPRSSDSPSESPDSSAPSPLGFRLILGGGSPGATPTPTP